MRQIRFTAALGLTAFVSLCLAVSLSGQESEWETLADGLQLGRFKADVEAPSGDSVITVLRVDPGKYTFHLLARSDTENRARHTVRKWCEEYDLIAAINAGMYAEDHSTHIGFMRVGDHVNNGRIVRRDYRSAAAFHPLNPNLPPFRIFDLDEIEMDSVLADYASVVQNIRLIKRPGENRWPRKPEKWSEAALGEDSDGFLLMIFCRSPYTMYEFNEILLSLPIDIVCAQHLEGGPQAQFYVRQGDTELELTGSYKADFLENDVGLSAGRIPNVIGISAVKTTPESD